MTFPDPEAILLEELGPLLDELDDMEDEVRRDVVATAQDLARLLRRAAAAETAMELAAAERGLAHVRAQVVLTYSGALSRLQPRIWAAAQRYAGELGAVIGALAKGAAAGAIGR